MGRIVRFSEFDNYLDNLKKERDEVKGTILDANVIITLSYSPKKYHTRILNFIEKEITAKGIKLFTTVTTTQEYLEFYRRLLITEGLRTVIHASSPIKIPQKEKKLIEAQSSVLKKREQRGDDPVFYDREIKKIREAFYDPKSPKGFNSWKDLCREFLKNQLPIEYKSLEKLKINYLSKYQDDGKEFFNKEISWDKAMDICSNMGIGFSDAMILNALQSSTLPFVVSLDVDMAVAVLGDDSLKDVLMPDGLIDSQIFKN
ncbi:MAG: hypothetical protein OXB88_01365 [Bacteriovoracales bacterium]|nr:hypothetical protein [Bacteriovoracales bacterium]